MTQEEIVAAVTKDDTVLVLQKQKDGNWKGWAKRGGNIVEERQVDPLYTLQALLTNKMF